MPCAPFDYCALRLRFDQGLVWIRLGKSLTEHIKSALPSRADYKGGHLRIGIKHYLSCRIKPQVLRMNSRDSNVFRPNLVKSLLQGGEI